MVVRGLFLGTAGKLPPSELPARYSSLRCCASIRHPGIAPLICMSCNDSASRNCQLDQNLTQESAWPRKHRRHCCRLLLMRRRGFMAHREVSFLLERGLRYHGHRSCTLLDSITALTIWRVDRPCCLPSRAA